MLKKMTIGMGMAGLGMTLLSAQAMAATSGFYIAAGAGQAEQHVRRDSNSGFINLTTPAFVTSPPATPHAAGRRLQTTFAVDGKSFGWGLTFGYRLNDYVAAELAYMDFGRAQIEEGVVPTVLDQPPPPAIPPAIPADSGGFTAVDDDPSVSVIFPARFRSDIRGPALSVLGSLPIAERWSLYLRAGVLFAQQDVAPFGRTLARGVSFHDEVLLGGVGATYELSPRFVLRAEYQRSDDIGSRNLPATTRFSQFQLSIAYQL